MLGLCCAYKWLCSGGRLFWRTGWVLIVDVLMAVTRGGFFEILVSWPRRRCARSWTCSFLAACLVSWTLRTAAHVVRSLELMIVSFCCEESEILWCLTK